MWPNDNEKSLEENEKKTERTNECSYLAAPVNEPAEGYATYRQLVVLNHRKEKTGKNG